MPKRHYRIFGIWLKAANQFVLVCEQEAHGASRLSDAGGDMIVIKRQVLRIAKVQNNISSVIIT